MQLISRRHAVPAELLQPVTWEGITFKHVVGMGAGFDKQGLLVRFLQAIGFAFIEIGTVLPNFQEGNRQPRIFRPFWGVLVNRMGFNSFGTHIVHGNLRRLWKHIHVPTGISLGKMKDTPLVDAWKDYVAGLKELFGFASYIAINVSSPNTPGLRELQGGKYLEHLVKKIVDCTEALARDAGRRAPPVLVKISPDDSDEDTLETVRAALRGGAKGVIIGNTSITTTIKVGETQESGGVSGYLILEKTLHKVRLVRAEFQDLFIIGVGGIMSGADAVRMKLAGANLIQLYTGFIFRGPPLIVECLRALLRLTA